MLSIPYELLGNKVVASAELKKAAKLYAGPDLGSDAQCDVGTT